MPSRKPLIVIVGPTASGKTAAAIAIAQRMNGSIISADSRQVYAGLNIGTAKPRIESSPFARATGDKGIRNNESGSNGTHGVLTPDLVEGIPHYLFNIRPLDQPLTLSEWQAAAFIIMTKVSAPILVGGTMLYVDSIVKNYDLPHVAPNQTLRQKLEQQPIDKLWQDLIARDPAVATFIEPNNRRRIIRALEVMDATGRLFSEQRRKCPSPYQTTVLGLFPGWDILEERIRERAHRMLEDGLLEETKRLMKVYSQDLPLLQTINYQQAKSVINENVTLEQALKEMVRANLRYAKRQMSWWKRNPDIKWFRSADELAKQAIVL